MNNKIKITLLILMLMFTPKISAYEAFNGNYTYVDENENNNYSTGISKNDDEILFIVDFSSSMNNQLHGKSLIKHALDAIKNILNSADISMKIGLRIFGVTDRQVLYRVGNVLKYDFEKLCEASSLILPVAGYNSSNIIEKLENTNPWGITPIQYSLEQAVQNDFSNDYTTKKHIILVTDGMENCNGNPCLYIHNLMKVRDDLKIDVIGITVDKNAYSQLYCIAKEGKGRFYPVNTPEDFKIKFKQAFSSTPDFSPSSNTKINIYPNKALNENIKYKNFVYQFDY